jgi:hypothetical protein
VSGGAEVVVAVALVGSATRTADEAVASFAADLVSMAEHLTALDCIGGAVN